MRSLKLVAIFNPTELNLAILRETGGGKGSYRREGWRREIRGGGREGEEEGDDDGEK